MKPTCEKWKYPDKKTVQSAINARMRGEHHGQRSKRMKRGRPDFLRPYFCNLCQAWHITKQHDRHDDHDS